MKNLDEKFWLKYFKVYDTLNNLKPYQDTLKSIVSAVDGTNLFALDLGCGTGNVIYALFNSGKLNRAIGIDYSQEALVIARKKNKKNFSVLFEYANLEDRLRYNDETFDLVVMNNVLYTIPIDSRQVLINEIYRVLKPGGIVIISSINDKFKPMQIYHAHIVCYFKDYGFYKTIFHLLKFIYPTVLIFYYNFLIKRANHGGIYNFMKKGEQYDLLNKAGFQHISLEDEVYAGSAFLNKAQK